MSKSQNPLRWPEHLQYTRKLHYHHSIPPDVKQFLQGNQKIGHKPRDPQFANRSATIIRPITDPAHPACGQHGLFAARKIPKKTWIIVYSGEVHSDDRPESDYDLCLYRSGNVINTGIDASRMGNEARFINDYRGVATKPNAVFVDERSVTGELQMSVWSSDQEIKKGDEILVSYGKGWWMARSGGKAAFDKSRR